MKDKFSKTLYVIKCKCDRQVIVTSSWQINAIRHSEKKWYDGKQQMEILRKATKEDLEMMEVEL